MTLTNPDPWSARIDFAKVLDEIAYLLGEPLAQNPLLREAVSERKLAESLEVPRSTLVGWLAGSEPRHFDGERLLAEWCRLTGKARTFAPVDRFVYSAAKASGIATRPSADKPKAQAMAA